MSQIIVAGNWKMHGSIEANAGLLEQLLLEAKPSDLVKVIVFPPAIYLQQAADMLEDSAICYGAQTVSQYEQGAYTGDIAASMLDDFGCRYVIVGHSERRRLYAEDSNVLAAKCFRAVDAGLTPIYCVGETEEQREQGLTEEVIYKQLDAIFVLENAFDVLCRTIIAYEPVWAIGTGKNANPEQADDVHKFIRHYLNQFAQGLGDSMQILYGGSVKATNAAGLFAMPNIDGGLIGGAALHAHEFAQIINAANEASQ